MNHVLSESCVKMAEGTLTWMLAILSRNSDPLISHVCSCLNPGACPFAAWLISKVPWKPILNSLPFQVTDIITPLPYSVMNFSYLYTGPGAGAPSRVKLCVKLKSWLPELILTHWLSQLFPENNFLKMPAPSIMQGLILANFEQWSLHAFGV